MEASILEENRQDWLVRYQHIFGRRNSKVQKNRFLKSLTADLKQSSLPVTSLAMPNAGKNTCPIVIAGDLKKAKKIVVTYYDSDYALLNKNVLSNKKANEKPVFKKMGAAIALWLVLLALWLLAYFTFRSKSASIFSFETLFWAFGFLALYFLARKIRFGGMSKPSLVKNTSSILCMLEMIYENTDPYAAYVFCDEGCQNEAGLQLIKEKASKKAKIYYLDSIGANETLHAKQTGPVTYIAACKEDGEEWFLTKSDLESQELNRTNMEQVQTIIRNHK